MTHPQPISFSGKHKYFPCQAWRSYSFQWTKPKVLFSSKLDRSSSNKAYRDFDEVQNLSVLPCEVQWFMLLAESGKGKNRTLTFVPHCRVVCMQRLSLHATWWVLSGKFDVKYLSVSLFTPFSRMHINSSFELLGIQVSVVLHRFQLK